MRITSAILAGSIAALAVLTTPVLAKAPQAQKTEDKSSPPPACYSYEQTADGQWKPLPCEEGPEGGARTQHRPAAASADEATH